MTAGILLLSHICERREDERRDTEWRTSVSSSLFFSIRRPSPLSIFEAGPDRPPLQLLSDDHLSLHYIGVDGMKVPSAGLVPCSRPSASARSRSRTGAHAVRAPSAR